MHTFATVIACGGQSSRLGEDKALQDIGGETVLARAIRRAISYGGPVALAARDKASFASEGHAVLADARPGIGPISALSSGFAFAVGEGCSHVLLLACDQPFLPDDLASRLDAAIGDRGVALPISGGRDQTMAALWRCDPARLEDYIAAGGRSLWQFAEAVGVTRVRWEVDDGDPFADIDDAGQLAAARARLARETP